VIYDLLDSPPPVGSLMESVILLVWQMRRDVDFYATRAVVQASMESDGEAVQNAWKDYEKKFYPYLEEQRKLADKAAIDFLQRESKKAYAVRPVSPLIKSRIRRRKDGERNIRMPGMRKRAPRRK